MEKRKYNAVDGLRAISCMGIVAMHIRSNILYDLPSDLFNRIILSFTDFVFLFMAMSSFGLCCGYYQRFADGSISWENFYKRRFAKILPFFITLIVFDICTSFSFDSLMQGLVESTLFFGFVPVQFSVIGVGWFLGLVFIFYLSFPFFCVLLKNKRTAWLTFIIAFGLNLICHFYYHIDRNNFAYSFCFFFTGGLIFLYRDRIERMKWWYFAILLIPSVVLYYFKTNPFTYILLITLLLGGAVSLDIRPLKPITFLSSISMEIYLCHMAVYRILDKLHVLDVFGGGVVQYIITCILVFIGACVMSVSINYFLEKLFRLIKNR